MWVAGLRLQARWLAVSMQTPHALQQVISKGFKASRLVAASFVQAVPLPRQRPEAHHHAEVSQKNRSIALQSHSKSQLLTNPNAQAHQGPKHSECVSWPGVASGH